MKLNLAHIASIISLSTASASAEPSSDAELHARAVLLPRPGPRPGPRPNNVPPARTNQGVTRDQIVEEVVVAFIEGILNTVGYASTNVPILQTYTFPASTTTNFFGPTVVPRTTRTYKVTEALLFPTPIVQGGEYVTTTTSVVIAGRTSIVAVVVTAA
ncbi:hypothetical protein FKW77_001174 [Venturia effusa]|uniref:Yeast cell wall synthesis Kre9/Knh1 C-terminal domain-containing protein n=1 Tax=Venturia effusa TaxID=50376 RepID=A0A517LQL3_9PEZI|nr:hypothetical protein FKW77_001174 [Venturia effusa]